MNHHHERWPRKFRPTSYLDDHIHMKPLKKSKAKVRKTILLVAISSLLSGCDTLKTMQPNSWNMT
jgi:hypothetical protein